MINSAIKIRQILSINLLFTLLCLALSGCNEPAKQPSLDNDLSVESIKALSPDIAVVRLIDTDLKNPAYRIAIEINKDPVTGSGQDWNTIAALVFKLSKALLTKSNVEELNLTYWMTDSSDVDWAKIAVKRSQLPLNWQQSTYQEFFASADPKPGSIHSGHWLCEFYHQYRLAIPKEGLPDYCVVSE